MSSSQIFFFVYPKRPTVTGQIAGLPASGAILPDYRVKNNEAGLRNSAADSDNWRLTATTGNG